MGAARDAWNAAQHPRGAQGRFARTGAIKIDYHEPRRRKPSGRPESAARQQHREVRQQADDVLGSFAQYLSGQPMRSRSDSHAYKRGMAAWRAGPGPHPGEPTVSIRDAMERATRGQRGLQWVGFRHQTKRTSTGKAVAERGYKSRWFGNSLRGFGTRTRVLNGAGKKPAEGRGTRRAKQVFAAAATYRPRHSSDDDD